MKDSSKIKRKDKIDKTMLSPIDILSFKGINDIIGYLR